MKIDIIIVTYNSEKWLKGCLESIEKQKKIDLNNINLYVIDNQSKDKTIKKLKEYQKNSKLGSFNIIENTKNVGFGIANNIGANKGKSEYVFFLNHDTELDKDSLYNMKKAIENSENDFAMWEFRQKPYEHPKYYNPITRRNKLVFRCMFYNKKRCI